MGSPLVVHSSSSCTKSIVLVHLLVINEMYQPKRKIIIKFPYNARSDWLKERALSENRARVDDGKLAFKFLLRNFDNFAPS